MKPILLLTLLFIIQNVFAQEKPVVINVRNNPDKSISLVYDKNNFGVFHVKVEFTRLENAYSSIIERDIYNQSGILQTLKPINKDKGINCSITYTSIRGILDPRFDPEFTYLIPLSPKSQYEVYELTNLNEKYAEAEHPKNWNAYAFYTEPGDTAFAARKGLVVEVEQSKEYNTEYHISYQNSINYVLVEHADGTIARYEGFVKDGLFVEPGQIVYPHNPLGVIAQYDVSGKGQLRFLVYYLDNFDDKKNVTTTYKEQPIYHAYVTPLFLTSYGIMELQSNQIYRPAIDEEIITKEFTRKEKKKFTSSE